MNPDQRSPDESNVPEDEGGVPHKTFDFPGSTPIIPDEAPAIEEPGNEPLDLDLNVDSDQAPADNLADLDEENQYGNL